MAGETEHTDSAAAPTEVEAMIDAARSAANRTGADTSRDSGPKGSDIDLLLRKAEEAIASLDEPSGELPAGIRPFDLQEFSGAPANHDSATLELVRDVELDLKIELGRTDMHLEDVLKLKRGSVVTLDKLAGDPVDVIVNGRLVARGEVLVLNDNFCVRVTELIVGESAVA